MKIKFQAGQEKEQIWEVAGFPVLIRHHKTKILHFTATENNFPEPWTEKLVSCPDGTQMRIVFSNAPQLERALRALHPYSGLILLSHQAKGFRLEIEC